MSDKRLFLFKMLGQRQLFQKFLKNIKVSVVTGEVLNGN
jgi:hypothetical protein